MFCPKCGSARDEKDKFCRNCGYMFTEETPITDKPQISAETLKKAKFYKYSLRVIFCAFTVLALLFCIMPVIAYPFRGASSVYGMAFESGFTNGLDGHWDNAYFIMTMFLNIFKNIDFVITPCALTVFILFFCVCFAISAVIVMFSKKRRTYAGAEASAIVFYALFALICIVMTVGIKSKYNMPVGAAPIALLLLSLTAFISSIALYIKRKKFFRENPAVKDKLNIKI